ncbi:MAG: hypothetical protein K0R61_4688 [Microvirga sp.]|nr:hypothetical protein [Microvirga sp.]
MKGGRKGVSSDERVARSGAGFGRGCSQNTICEAASVGGLVILLSPLSLYSSSTKDGFLIQFEFLDQALDFFLADLAAHDEPEARPLGQESRHYTNGLHL